MKITLIGFFMLLSTAGFGQSAPVLSNTASPVVILDHPQRASAHSLRPEDNLWGDSAYSFAQGEQPLSDFGTGKIEVPLGDIARQMRKVHATDLKSTKVVSND